MMNFLLGLILILISGLANAQFTNQQKQYLTMDNLLVNPGLENGKSGWTCANGTFTASSATGEKIDGGLSGKVVLTAQILDCEIKAPTNSSLLNSTALILQSIKSSVAGIEVCPIVDNVVGTVCQNYDGSNILKEVSPVIPFFGSTNIGIKIRTTGAVTGTVFFDGSRISRMSSAFTGNVVCKGTIPCEDTFSAKIDSSGVVTDEKLNWINGNCAPSSNFYTCSFNTGVFSVTPNCVVSPLETAAINGTLAMVNAQSSSSVTYKINRHDSAAINAGANIFCQKQGVDFTRSVQSSGFLANYVPWKVDVNIGGANPNLGISNISSYTEITDASLDLVVNSGSASARIPCSSTNASTGLTCSAGSESLGVNIPSLPYPGEFRVCASFTHARGLQPSSSVVAAFQLVETSLNSQTIVQEGKSRLLTRIQQGATGQQMSGDVPLELCGNFIFNDTSEKTIRIMYEQDVGGSFFLNSVYGDRLASLGQRDVHIVVTPVTPFMVASVANMVTTPGILSPKFRSFKVNTAGVVFDEVGDTIAGNCSLGGTTYTCTFASGIWSTVVNCANSTTAGLLNGANLSALNLTTIQWNTAAAGANNVAQTNWLCHGF